MLKVILLFTRNREVQAVMPESPSYDPPKAIARKRLQTEHGDRGQARDALKSHSCRALLRPQCGHL